MKKNLQLFFLGSCLILMVSCNQPDPAAENDRKEAVEMTEAMRKTHDGLQEKLDFMKKENGDLSGKIKDMEQPDSLMVAAVLQTDAIITHYEAVLKSQKELIDQNEKFIRQDDKTALSDAEKQARHQQIKLNYETVQNEAAALLQQVEAMKTKHVIVGANEKEEQ